MQMLSTAEKGRKGTNKQRGISSVGLEHLPCTQGVKGSSPLFSTERRARKLEARGKNQEARGKSQEARGWSQEARGKISDVSDSSMRPERQRPERETKKK